MRFGRLEAILFGFLSVVLAMTTLIYASHRKMVDDVGRLLGHAGPVPFEEALLLDPVFAVLFGLLIVSVIALVMIVRQHSSDNQALRRHHAALAEEAVDLRQEVHRDALTGLKNRRYFDETLSHYLAEFAKVDRPVGLMILDLDRFKLINDRHGHDAGDEVLRTVAEALMTSCRDGDIVARLGGEEFAIIVPNMHLTELRSYADGLRGMVERLPVGMSGVAIAVSTSIGVAVSVAGEGPATLCKRADINLYRAKLEGRNRIAA